MAKNKTPSFGFGRILIGLFSAFGFGIMSYLTYIHYASSTSFCDISEKVSCDVVTTGIYSEIFGLPVSFLGMGYFGLVFILLLVQKKQEVFKFLFLLTLFVLVPSLYLSAIEIFAIGAFCILCESSKALMFAILITSAFLIGKGLKQLISVAAFVVFSGIVASGVTYFAQTGNVAKEDYSEFAQKLTEKGWVYYKSVKCNNCKRQERLFGEAINYINSVECHPEGKNPQVELCLKKGISKTPTWILEKDGTEVKRLEGLQKIKDLSEEAEIPLD